MERLRAVRARRSRALRGAASAAIATVLAATAHTISGGLAPLWLIAAAAVLATPVSVWLVGRAPSPVRTGLVVLASQGLFHTLFGLAGSADPALADATSGAAVHLHSAVFLGGAGDAGTAGSHLHALTPTMTATHLAAAAVTAVLLSCGERMLHAVARGIRRVLGILSPLVPPVFPAAAAPADRRWRPASLALRSSLTLRGPPVLV
ncbi:hypothetical protein [Microbacterium radiodurans]|uniref:Uncharacterized protein n=1 Tax=Microbacterium radiodurans TaxID=661398 RepID=A0A5J5IW65_9MICO|nr:hypothetical protein [Microbacterium radiodurans]KAA9089949.1 hypothetical protein F6B42_05795 [Microbacterium radiodurans]